MDVHLGMAVRSQDDTHVGKVDRIVVPESGGPVQSLVIHKGLFFARDVLVPLEFVRMVDEDGVHLALTEDQLDRLPDFIEEQYAPSPLATTLPTYSMGGVMFPLGVEPGVAPLIINEVKDLPPGAGDIARGYTVLCADGVEAGTVHDVMVDSARGVAEYLVVEGAAPPGDAAEDLGTLRIPATAIAHVADEVVTLTLPSSELRAYAAGAGDR